MTETLGFNTKPLIVFVHGLLGFSTINFPGFSVQYFRGLERHLLPLGVPMLYPKTASVGTIAERAHHLAALLGKYQEKDIYLIAHSMGGLDSRYLIHSLDPDKRIRALVTVGTPHRGTSLADWFIHDRSFYAGVGRYITRPALFELTPEACSRFNELIPDRADVRYLSYAGCRPVSGIPCILKPLARHVQKYEGDNDGQVPVTSAAWGDFQGELRADHLELVGWSFARQNRKTTRPFDHLSFYEMIVGELLGM